MKKNITLLTGSRAEWGILRPLYIQLCKQDFFNVSLIVTGTHLSQKYGYTADEVYQDVQNDYYELKVYPDELLIDAQTKMFLTVSEIIKQIPQLYRKIKTDLLIILGDRYEVFAAASAARLEGIKIAHISGGEITLAAFDDVLRHCITKLSDIHFVADQACRKRVIQMGELPARVYVTGELATHGLHNFSPVPREQLEKILQISLENFFLVTFHPQTCNPGLVSGSVEKIISSMLNEFKEHNIIITASNADPEGNKINQILKQITQNNSKRIRFVNSLGRDNYLSAATICSAAIGNSSSFITELSYMPVCFVNIGDRQTGREHNGYNSSFDEQSVIDCINKCLNCTSQSKKQNNCKDPVSEVIKVLESLNIDAITRAKPFYDL